MSTLTGPESEFERLRASQSRRYLPAVVPACFPTVASTSPKRPVADEKQRRIQVWLGSGSHARNALKGFGLRSLALGFRFQVSGLDCAANSETLAPGSAPSMAPLDLIRKDLKT